MNISADASKTLTAASLWHAISAFPQWLTAPTVLAEWTIEPRWHQALKHVRMLLILAAYSLSWYWFGGYASASSNSPAAPIAFAAVKTALVEPERVSLSGRGNEAPSADVVLKALPPEDTAGLRIDNFRIGAVSGYPNRLRYELGLSNKGRKLVGKLQFMVVGEQNGELREMPLDQPAALADAKPKVEVSRLLNTRGYLDLPEGYVVHKVVVQVVEGSSPRVAQSAPMWPT